MVRPDWFLGPWLYSSWIYNYLSNQCLSPLMLWAWILLRHGVLDTTLCDKVFEWLAAGRWFSPGILVSSTNKTDRHDISEILLKVVLNTITLTPTGERTQKICQTWGEHILKVHCITGTVYRQHKKTICLNCSIKLHVHTQGFQYVSSLPVLHYLQGVLLSKFEHFHEYLIQHSLKSGGTKYTFRWVKIPGTAPYWKTCTSHTLLFLLKMSSSFVILICQMKNNNHDHFSFNLLPRN